MLVSVDEENYAILVMRHNFSEKDIIYKELYQKTGREKPKTIRLRNITHWTDIDLEIVLLATDNRSQWRRIIRGAVKPRIEHD